MSHPSRERYLARLAPRRVSQRLLLTRSVLSDPKPRSKGWVWSTTGGNHPSGATLRPSFAPHSSSSSIDPTGLCEARTGRGSRPGTGILRARRINPSGLGRLVAGAPRTSRGDHASRSPHSNTRRRVARARTASHRASEPRVSPSAQRVTRAPVSRRTWQLRRVAFAPLRVTAVHKLLVASQRSVTPWLTCGQSPQS